MTEVIKVDEKNIEQSLIQKAAGIIKRGGVVAFPTETVYGLAANVFDDNAVRKIFEVKKRSSDKPLAVCVSSLDQLSGVATSIPPEAKAVIEEFLPGPLTLILLKKNSIPDIVTTSKNNVGIRYPDHRIALALIDTAGVPVAATSANISGKESPTTAQEVLSQLSGDIDLVIDGGPTEYKVASTVIDFTAQPYRILREGAISKQDLDHFLVSRHYSPLAVVPE